VAIRVNDRARGIPFGVGQKARDWAKNPALTWFNRQESGIN